MMEPVKYRGYSIESTGQGGVYYAFQRPDGYSTHQEGFRTVDEAKRHIDFTLELEAEGETFTKEDGRV